MNKLLPILLLIGLVGSGQTNRHKEGEIWSDASICCTFYHHWHNGHDEVDTMRNSNDFRAYTTPPDQPRTATAWPSLQNEVNELKKQLDSLIKSLRANLFNGMRLLKPDTFSLRHWYSEDSISIPEVVYVQPASNEVYRTNIADPASAKVIHFNNGCDLGTVRHGKGWARKHKVKK